MILRPWVAHHWLDILLVIWVFVAWVCLYFTWQTKYHPRDQRFAHGLQPSEGDTEPRYETSISWFEGIVGSLGWPVVLLVMLLRWALTAAWGKLTAEYRQVQAMRKLGR